jgi:hypothetical protein
MNRCNWCKADIVVEQLRPLVERFEARHVPAEEWTHEAHIRVGLFYVLDSADMQSAIQRMRSGIQQLNESHGVPQTRTRGYHETLTVLWLHLISAEWRRSADWAQLWAKLQDKTLPLQFYSKPLVMSWEARTGWVDPDLRALPS